jgi:ribulose-phosphate 3-epimerase
VTAANAGELAAAGAEILVAGTAIYGADDPAAAIARLRGAAVATVQA